MSFAAISFRWKLDNVAIYLSRDVQTTEQDTHVGNGRGSLIYNYIHG